MVLLLYLLMSLIATVSGWESCPPVPARRPAPALSGALGPGSASACHSAAKSWLAKASWSSTLTKVLAPSQLAGKVPLTVTELASLLIVA